MKFKTSEKLIAHIDCDSFFASCELLVNPKLKNKYVCVGGEIVVAATYNAKKKGVGVGTPVWQARDILGPKAVFLGVNFELYGEISRKLMTYLEKNTLKIEKFSIDEAFCEITGLPEMYKISCYEYIEKLQTDIKDLIGIPVSIGVSNTRIKAKIFSDIHKPYGICIGNITDTEEEVFSKLSFGKIPFAGKQSQKRFRYRCRSIQDFKNLGFWQLKNEVGKSMTTLRLELQGVNAFIIDNKKMAKSISRSRSFNKHKTCNKQFLLSQILSHFETVYSWLIEGSTEIQEMGIMLRDGDFQTHRLNHHFPEHTNDRKKMFRVLKELFEKLYSPSYIYRSSGVNFYKLRSSVPKQLDLFDVNVQKKDRSCELSRVMNIINSKYGRKKLTFGNTGNNKKLSEKVTIRS